MMKHMLAMVAAATLAATASAQTLRVGDEAPKFEGKVTWLKGEPVDQFKPGQVYVIDFWATWCGPCIAAMPHLNDVANEYREKGVTVIGAAIWPRENMEPTDEFVEAQGDDMNYVVAEDIDDRLAEAYMEASRQRGIPTTMIIDRDGHLAWIGHPMFGLDEALARVTAPDYDLSTVVAQQREIERGRRLVEQAEQLAMDGKWDESFAIIDEVVAIDPNEFGQLAVIKFQYLLGRFQRVEEGYAYGRKLVDTVLHDNPVLLENIAKFIVEGPGFEPRDYKLATKAIERAVELTEGEEPAVLDTLARVCFAKGDPKDAHEAITKALKLVDDDRVKADMEKRLAQYAEAMEKRSS